MNPPSIHPIAAGVLLFFASLALLISPCSSFNRTTVHKPKCTWTKHENQPEIYFINLERSINRKIVMENHLSEVGFRYFRVRGLTPKEIYIPDDVEKFWLTRWCPSQTSWNPANTTTELSSYAYQKYAMAAMCGRKKNTPKEIGCTTSHLHAMRQAIYSTTATSRYALIVEDDVFFPFDVDYNALAESAPKDFGILQLFNSNQPTMKHTWDKYLRNPSANLWMKRNAASFEYWSTCAYLIDRFVMKPVIDAVVLTERVLGVTEFKLVAGVTNPCTPKECCTEDAPNRFNVVPPCVYAPRGYQADSYLYAMTKTYMMSLPLITNGMGGNQSTFHQFHVELLHRRAFKQQREMVNEMLLGKVQPPPFAKPACEPLDADFL
jgi:GR25 family glycosyltransferase involved in LPS biosynthesis